MKSAALQSVGLVVLLCMSACSERTGGELRRRGDEIVIAGRLFHTGAPVVLWTQAGGYDGYRTEKRFVTWARAAFDGRKDGGARADGVGSPNRYGVRFAPKAGDRDAGANGGLTSDEFERVRGGGWDVETLSACVDQFVLHYDVSGVSRECFRILHDVRGLSVHFMLDIDGTIYQTMDVKERAWHATTCNDRSVGVEIANIGAYGENDSDKALNAWYEPDPGSWLEPELAGDTPGTWSRITIPARLGDGGVRSPGTFSPIRPGPVYGLVQGRMLRQYDLTAQQYDSLERLTATLCTVLPRIRCDYPRDGEGRLLTEALSEEQLREYRGVLGHFHIQANKIDPGPALQWDRVIEGARRRMGRRAEREDVWE